MKYTLVSQSKADTTMNNMVSAIVILALVAVTIGHAASEQAAGSNQQQPQHQVALLDRQGRSIDTSSGKSNIIEHHSSKKLDLEKEKRAVQDFLTTKNIFKSIIKLLFGNSEEITQTSRSVLTVFGKVLDLLKNTFGQKSRSGTARTIRDSAEEAANAGITMLQGYVKSITSENKHCVLRNLCQASKEATRESRDLGYIIASVGGYASSYLLDGQVGREGPNFKAMYDASLKGRSGMEDCAKQYSECYEDKPSS